PNAVETVGLEMRLEAEVGPVTLRGIIDRLERDHDGALVVSDYKTGRTPPPAYRKKSMSGVHFYALLCREVLDERPRSVRLLYGGSVKPSNAAHRAGHLVPHHSGHRGARRDHHRLRAR
ncbi:MAG: RecB family exonuclease, partial [Ilumatobacteraceae bacterium]